MGDLSKSSGYCIPWYRALNNNDDLKEIANEGKYNVQKARPVCKGYGEQVCRKCW